MMLSMVVAMRPFGVQAGERSGQQRTPQVKNVIMLIGDGMGVAHITSLMLEGGYEPVNMDRAEAAAMVKTYSANNRVTDSAAAGTALATGHKTGNHYIGVTIEGDTLTSLLTRAVREGRHTGIVVTCYLTHATPAAFYAHVPNRNQYQDIALQFMDSGIEVAFGGGRRDFVSREDGRDLEDELERRGYAVINEFDDTEDIVSGRVVGIFADEHLPSLDEGRGDYLPQAAAKALDILTANAGKDGKGIFMMIEGSQIDMEAHSNDPEGILEEMRDFDRAVGVAFDYADAHPGTLVVICADHETGGMSMPSCKSDFTLAESGVEYKFGSTSHTATMTPALFYGTGAKEFAGIMDNTELSRRIAQLMGLGE